MTKIEPISDVLITNYRIKASLWVSVIAIAIVIPLAINHLYQERYELGFGTFLIVALFLINGWQSWHGYYRPRLIFWTIVPVISIFLAYAIPKQGIIIALWCYPSLVVFYFMLKERQAWSANILLLVLVLPGAWEVLDPSIYFRFVITLLGVSAFSASFVRVIKNQQSMLEKQAVTDPLTGTFNRALLQSKMEKMIQQSNRSDSPMSIVMLDIDNFKMINDSFGHDCGDTVLKGVGDYLNSRIRATDEVYRYGGEEFLLLLFNTNSDQSIQVAEEICDELPKLSLIPDHQLSASFGVSSYKAGENQDSWLKRCDDNLYKAKTTGKNKVVFS